MYLIDLFLIFSFHLSFNLAVPRVHNWRAHHKELQQLFSNQIGQMNMEKGTSWTTVPNLSPSLFGIGTPMFYFIFFSFWVFNSGRLLLEHQCLKKCLNWTLDWMCGTELFMHALCYLQISFKFCCALWYQYLVKINTLK